MKIQNLLLAAAAAAMLAGCQSGPQSAPPPVAQPGPQPPVPVTPPPQPTVTAGPLKPAGVGRYMDGLERDLRLSLRGSGIVAARRGDDMLVTILNVRLFAGQGIAPAGQALLDRVAQVLRTYDHTHLQVNGYTDTSGTPEQNLTLTMKRAEWVGDALTHSGIASSRIETHGFGGTSLKIVTGDHVNEPRNRRIEIRIVPRPE